MEDGMVFVVEYDIPETPKLRQRFYRAIKRYLAENNIYGRYSTQSVVITKDYNFASFVFDQAIAVGGRAVMYEAKEIRHYRDEAFGGDETLRRANEVVAKVLAQVFGA